MFVEEHVSSSHDPFLGERAVEKFYREVPPVKRHANVKENWRQLGSFSSHWEKDDSVCKINKPSVCGLAVRRFFLLPGFGKVSGVKEW